MDRRTDAHGLDGEIGAVEGHEDRPPAEGADLVHEAARRAGAPLARPGDLHLRARLEPEAVDLREGARHQHAERRRRRQPLSHRQVGGADLEPEPTDGVVREDLGRDARGVAEESTVARRGRERFDPRRPAHRSATGPVGEDARDLDDAVRRRRTGAEPLVRPGDETPSRDQVRRRRAIAAGPVRMLAEETESSGNEEVDRHAHRPWNPNGRPST